MTIRISTKRPLDHDQQLLGALQRLALLRERVAAVHDDLAEVVGEIAPEPVLELGDLLGRVAVAVELGDRGVVEQAETLQRLQAVGDQRQEVDGDLTVLDGDAVDESVALHHVEERAVAALEDRDQRSRESGSASRLLSRSSIRCVVPPTIAGVMRCSAGGRMSLRRVSRSTADITLSVRRAAKRVGDPRLLDRRLDRAGDLRLVEHRVARPEPDDACQQTDHGDHAEDRCPDRANPFHASASLLRRSARHAAIAGVRMSVAPRVAR